MQPTLDAIFDAAAQLPETERLALISRLLSTVPEESLTLSVDDPDFEAELDRRFADPAGAIPWSQLRSER